MQQVKHKGYVEKGILAYYLLNTVPYTAYCFKVKQLAILQNKHYSSMLYFHMTAQCLSQLPHHTFIFMLCTVYILYAAAIVIVV